MTGIASPVPTQANSDQLEATLTPNGHDSRATLPPSTPPPSQAHQNHDSPNDLDVASDSEPLSSPLSELSLDLNHDLNNGPTPDASESEPHQNGHMEQGGTIDGDRPTKRRRTDATTPPPRLRKPKDESPPWKKIEADGPTSFHENGRRKSGRINTIPIEHQQGDKRITRRALHGPQGSPPAQKNALVNGHTAPGSAPASRHSRKSVTSSKSSQTKVAPRRSLNETKTSSRSRRAPTPPPTRTPTRTSTRTARSSRNARDSFGPSLDSVEPGVGTRTTPRIKLRVKPQGLPFVHPDQAKARPQLFSSFKEYFEKAADIPVEEGGMFTLEDGPVFTREMAVTEAALIDRIERETEEGGLLTMERCAAFQQETAEEPPRQWAHMDHLVKAMSNFRKLMVMEHHRHRAAAKKLAEACRDEWRRRQPKTAEELEQEARLMWVGRYRVVVRAMAGTWENVRTEINRRRLVEWEAEEQRRVKAALQEAVEISEQKLQARRTRLDDEDGSDDSDLEIATDDDDGESGSESADDMDVDSHSEDGNNADEDNMSSSDDDEDAKSTVSDEGLTQEQLREKYSQMPDVEQAIGSDAPGGDGEAEGDTLDHVDADTLDTSDESVDMDDDLGSSGMDSSDDDDDDDGSSINSDGSDDNQPPGLLGLFFGKSELASLKAETPQIDEAQSEAQSLVDASTAQDTDMVDAAVAESSSAPITSQPLQESLDLDGEHRHQMVEPASRPSPETQESRGSQEVIDKGDTAVASVKDVAMPDAAPAPAAMSADSVASVPGVEVTAPAIETKPHSPETDAITAGATPEHSQSPHTTNTRVSEPETSSSVELLSAPKDGSRSVSPQPGLPKTEIPFLLRGTLREYQHYGLDWLAGLYANNTNGILADEMGLGKTIQTISLLAHLACHHEVWGPHLVIVPTSVMLNWEMEFKKWCPGFKILTYYGTTEERKRKRVGWSTGDEWNVCITSYQMAVIDSPILKKKRWHYMILDEAHNIKNFKSQRWQTLLGFNTHSRLLITGTPLQNNLTELWSLLFFLMPSENGEGGFADLREFHDWFQRPESQILDSGREHMDEESRAIVAKLHKVLRPYLLRRMKADVEKEIPGKYEHVEFCRLSKRQRELYDGFLARADTRETLASKNYLSIINCLMQLRKVCNHPDLFVDRPIMTSFKMQKSVPAEFGSTDRLIRKTMLAQAPMSSVSLGFLNLIPTQHESLSAITAASILELTSQRTLTDLKEAQRKCLPHPYPALEADSVESNLAHLEKAGRWSRFEELQHCVYLNALRRQQKPIYGTGLVQMLTVGVDQRPYKPRPKVPRMVMEWFENDSFLLHNVVPSLQRRAEMMETTIAKFACVTPAVVTRDLSPILLGSRGVESFTDIDMKLSAPVKYLPFVAAQAPLDPWHEARMRLSIQFPDKRLLQYDCGKLQTLDRLLRKLHAGGHRALIFTQMTKVLDLLERFLNIHGHKYLRLDGTTKVEQRQILTDRFNHDDRIFCFILSTRSGGLGINLTGADTVIFYDQDWNPAMDKQCQDRCHRIGQTRDVHIYRLVSEHTIEANILRKASQKQMLDDVVIQEGGFTTDYFNKLSVQDVIGKEDDIGLFGEGNAAANAAMDRVLGGVESGDQRTAGRVLEQAEDQEDVVAARLAEKENQQDDADFSEKQPPASASGSGSGVSSVRQGTPRDEPLGRSALGLFAESAEEVAKVLEEEFEHNAYGKRMHTIDVYMLDYMAVQLEGTPLDLPKDKKKAKKKGRDTRKR